MSKEAKEISEYLKETGFSAWVEHPDYGSYTDEYVNWLEKQTQSLKDKIERKNQRISTLVAEKQGALDEIKELKKQSFIEKVARGNIEMTPSQVLEYAELKESNTCNCPPLDVTTFDSDLPCDWCTTCGKKI